MRMNEDFIGAGWAFPLRTDATGSVALARREREIEQSIHLILGTAYGERPMRPEFGCGIHDHVFDSPDATTAGILADEVEQSLARWEARIEVNDVVVSNDPAEPSTLYIDILYTILGSSDPRNLVFPFYVLNEEPATTETSPGGGP
jgi:phage baseplate assembly protein W